MTLKGIIDTDYVQYYKPCMTLMFPKCSFKCDKESGRQICINNRLTQSPNIEINVYTIIERYLSNDMVDTLCCAGLEPFDSPAELNRLLSLLRFCECDDDVLIFTGYTEDEVNEQFKWIYAHKNIIIKFGRFLPETPAVFDDLLQKKLASRNQYAKRIT